MKNTSIWLCFLAIIPAATMMHPTFASLIAVVILTMMVFAVRFVAHWEGRADMKQRMRPSTARNWRGRMCGERRP